jgi:hypothetical protein
MHPLAAFRILYLPAELKRKLSPRGPIVSLVVYVVFVVLLPEEWGASDGDERLRAALASTGRGLALEDQSLGLSPQSLNKAVYSNRYSNPPRTAANNEEQDP